MLFKKFQLFRKSITILFAIGFLALAAGCSKETVNSKDGVSISYTVKGKGPLALVFVHGWSCDRSYWDIQVDHFSKKYKVIAVDLAGHGDSGLERKNYTIDAFGEDVAAVVNSVAPEKVLLVGHSMGGSVNMEAAGKIKTRIIGLIGADTYHDMGMKLTDKQKEMYMVPLTKDFKKGTYNFVLSMFPKDADQKLVKKIATDMSEQPSFVAISAMKNLFIFSDLMAHKARSLKVPIKSINADIWPTNIKANKNINKTYEARIMKGIGHFVAQERPEEFNRLLEEYISELNK